MPLPEDLAVVETAGNLVKTLQGAFVKPAGYRPAHAHGRLVRGNFTPTDEAAPLSTAPHLNNAFTPVIVRFSSSTGIPDIPDTDPNANPRGMAIRFVLSEDGHKHTDIVAHSTPFFPVRTGEGFVQMLEAIGGVTIGKFLEENPSAAAFVQAPKPFPSSFATEKYYGLNAFKLVSDNGSGTFVRYRMTPDAGHSVLSESDVASKSKTYLFDELPERLSNGPASFKLHAQVAEEGDPTDDATKHWPGSRKVVELGTIKVDSVEEETESKREQQRIIFDPVPRVEGIEPSADPLLDMRAAVYLISGRERRAAPSPQQKPEFAAVT
ncbi:hypothetical protein LTR37_014493 [Vermiconidia calcicola]|uniref:Uncharacterized protein n=1 Tax=Vermiconidia calcicola TaxID=1690605 RepID=A0ACC3MTQ3_9PEZI|nr:hypothetical protein LTR37_014493 [Vermiconidia calcicola]